MGADFISRWYGESGSDPKPPVWGVVPTGKVDPVFGREWFVEGFGIIYDN